MVSPSVCKRWTKQQSPMPDELRSPIKHPLVLHKRDPERRVAR
jgi:hypothetical protein